MKRRKFYERRLTGLLIVLSLAIGIVVPAASAGNHKVSVCHSGKTLEVNESAVPGHLAHGDTLGECSEPGEEPGDDGDDNPPDNPPGDGGNSDPGSEPPAPPTDEGADTSQTSRVGYCMNGKFYDLVAGQDLSDPQYTGATEAKVGLPGNSNAVHCDNPPSETPASETAESGVLAATVPDSLRWCGKTFTTRKEFRTYFGLTRAEMKAFLASHPAAAAILK